MLLYAAAAAAAKSLQSCPTLCDPIDGGPPGSPVPGILQARTLEWVAISFSNAWKGKVKVKSLSRVRLFATPWSAAYQAPLSMGFSRQEYWSGVPLPSPMLLYIYIQMCKTYMAPSWQWMGKDTSSGWVLVLPGRGCLSVKKVFLYLYEFSLSQGNSLASPHWPFWLQPLVQCTDSTTIRNTSSILEDNHCPSSAFYQQQCPTSVCVLQSSFDIISFNSFKNHLKRYFYFVDKEI